MTDRIQAFTVVLEHDWRDEDAEGIRQAILRIKGVMSVSAHITDISDHVARLRARDELLKKVLDVFKP